MFAVRRTTTNDIVDHIQTTVDNIKCGARSGSPQRVYSAAVFYLRMEAYIFLALTVILSCTSVRGQNECPAIQESELGSTTTPGTSGLIADAVALGDSGSAPDILVLDSQTVCLAVGPTRDLYRYASVVVSFNCSGSLDPGNALGISTCGGELTVQFDFECVAGPQWQALTLVDDNVFNPADGSLTTSPRTDCSFCVDPAEAGSFGLTVDMATHCAGRLKNWRYVCPYAVTCFIETLI